MKVIIIAVVQAIPHVLLGLIFVIFIFFVLGVVGVKLFKGKFYACNDPTILRKSECYGTYHPQVQGPIFEREHLAQREWQRFQFHFDHLGAALLTLFVVTAGDDWADIMYSAMDTTEADQGPQEFYSAWASLYFVAVFISCNFFALNMMIGVLIQYFSQKKRLYDGSALLTPHQRLYVKARYAIDETVVTEDLIARESRAAQIVADILCYRVEWLSQRTSLFDIFMMGVIIINTIVLAATFEGEPRILTLTIEYVNIAALVIFAIEAIMRLFAYGFLQYFSNGWNLFDFTVVIVGIASTAFSVAGLAVFRVVRVFKMIKGTGVEKLLRVLVRSINSFTNVIAILLLTFFIFAVAGVVLFGKVKWNGPLGPNRNFNSVPMGMFTLYQVATINGWTNLMDACSIQSGCTEGEDCGNLYAATAYFVIFIVVCSFTVLQLFVAVVVEIFLDDVFCEDPVVVAFSSVKTIWTDMFGVRTTHIGVMELVELLPRLPIVLTELEHGRNSTRGQVVHVMDGLMIPINSQGRVAYRDVVYSLAFRKYRVDLRSMAKYLNDTVVNIFGMGTFTAAQAFAAMLMQSGWRKYKARLSEAMVFTPSRDLLSRKSKKKYKRSTGLPADADTSIPAQGASSEEPSDEPPSGTSMTSHLRNEKVEPEEPPLYSREPALGQQVDPWSGLTAAPERATYIQGSAIFMFPDVWEKQPSSKANSVSFKLQPGEDDYAAKEEESPAMPTLTNAMKKRKKSGSSGASVQAADGR